MKKAYTITIVAFTLVLSSLITYAQPPGSLVEKSYVALDLVNQRISWHHTVSSGETNTVLTAGGACSSGGANGQFSVFVDRRNALGHVTQTFRVQSKKRNFPKANLALSKLHTEDLLNGDICRLGESALKYVAVACTHDELRSFNNPANNVRTFFLDIHDTLEYPKGHPFANTDRCVLTELVF